MLMILGHLFPLGVLQLGDVVTNGYWHARTEWFQNYPWLSWARMPGDVVFMAGSAPLVWLTLKVALRTRKTAAPVDQPEAPLEATLTTPRSNRPEPPRRTEPGDRTEIDLHAYRQPRVRHLGDHDPARYSAGKGPVVPSRGVVHPSRPGPPPSAPAGPSPPDRHRSLPMSEPGHQTPTDESTIDLTPPTPTAPPSVRVEFGARTHVGRVRPNNEDRHLIARLSKSLQVLRTDLPRGNSPRVWGEEGYLLAVADGMGGAAAGERASALVVEGLEEYVLDVFKWFSHPGEPQEEAFMDQIGGS